jgi:hypothetical protein
MNDPARDALIQIINEFGASIIDTPKSLATLLRQQAKAVPRDVDTLVAAAQNAIPTTIKTNPHYDPDSLARMPAARANWAVRTWIAALDQSAKPVATAARGITTAGAIFVVVGALAVGAMAFLIFGR